MEDEYSLQLQLALLIVSKYHKWTRQKQSSVGRDSCRHCTTHIVWDEESPAAGQIRSGQLETLPSARTYLDGRIESFKSQSLEGEVWTGICRGVWMEIKAPPHPSRTRHFSLTKPESRAARLVTCSFVACIYHADMYIMLGQLFKGWQKIYFLTFSCSEILTSNCVLYFHVYRMKNSHTKKLLNVGYLSPFHVSSVLYTMKLNNKN